MRQPGYMVQDTVGLTCVHLNTSAFPTSISGGAERARKFLRNHTIPSMMNKKQTKAFPLRRLGVRSWG